VGVGGVPSRYPVRLQPAHLVHALPAGPGRHIGGGDPVGTGGGRRRAEAVGAAAVVPVGDGADVEGTRAGAADSAGAAGAAGGTVADGGEEGLGGVVLHLGEVDDLVLRDSSP
jgi:hypothetical protein